MSRVYVVSPIERSGISADVGSSGHVAVSRQQGHGHGLQQEMHGRKVHLRLSAPAVAEVVGAVTVLVLARSRLDAGAR